MTAELLDAARECSETDDRYRAACLRLAIARGIENVPAAEWDAETLAACQASNAAQDRLHALCGRLFPQAGRATAWNEYYAKFYGAKAVAP